MLPKQCPIASALAHPAARGTLADRRVHCVEIRQLASSAVGYRGGTLAIDYLGLEGGPATKIICAHFVFWRARELYGGHFWMCIRDMYALETSTKLLLLGIRAGISIFRLRVQVPGAECTSQR